ncbi:hypothetical protein GpartN1_g3101.t1 [Galdieria partita]|uniref:Rhodanese domain-containing protein n=1 Tax=Galdieria partita TaxID=83374 RepID=A0A9C7PVW1_9RHOD|nr:hypothetical protein GpartN1_g3101.t1 [Galdieria partita]
MSSLPLFSIKPDKLVESLRQGELRSGKLVVVDVRDDDRSLGSIVGSYWLPSDEFIKDVRTSVNHLLEVHPKAKKFVFHCQLSKVRGPRCANMFREEVAMNHQSRAQDMEVYLLEGGFQAFSHKYCRDRELVNGT